MSTNRQRTPTHRVAAALARSKKPSAIAAKPSPRSGIVPITHQLPLAEIHLYADSVNIIDADVRSNGHGPDNEFAQIIAWLDRVRAYIVNNPGVLFPCLIVATASRPLAEKHKDALFARGAAIHIKPPEVDSWPALKAHLLKRFGVTTLDGKRVIGWPYLSATEKERRRKMQEANKLSAELAERLRQNAKNNDEPVSDEAYQEKLLLVTGQEDKLREKYAAA